MIPDLLAQIERKSEIVDYAQHELATLERKLREILCQRPGQTIDLGDGRCLRVTNERGQYVVSPLHKL